MTEDQIVDDIWSTFSDAGKDELRKLGGQRMLTALHHGMGTQIRNYYGLWSTSPVTERWRNDPSSHDIQDGCDCSKDHPDAVSMRVIERLWIKAEKELA